MSAARSLGLPARAGEPVRREIPYDQTMIAESARLSQVAICAHVTTEAKTKIRFQLPFRQGKQNNFRQSVGMQLTG